MLLQLHNYEVLNNRKIIDNELKKMCKCWWLSLRFPLYEWPTILFGSPFYHVVKHESCHWSFIAYEGCIYREFRVHLVCQHFNLNYFFGEPANPQNIGQTTWCHNSEDQNLNICPFKNLNSQILWSVEYAQVAVISHPHTSLHVSPFHPPEHFPMFLSICLSYRCW